MTDLPHQVFARNRVMIMAAPNGARKTKSDHPAVPLTASELANEAVALLDVGVSVLHLHVRTEDGHHTLDIDRYRQAISAIRARVGDKLVIQVTSEAVGIYEPEQQMHMVRTLQPEAISLALRELAPDDSHIPALSRLFEDIASQGTWPQVILYNQDDLRRFDALRRDGVFSDDRTSCLLVLGRYASDLNGRPEELDAFLAAVDCSNFPWSVCCFGPAEQQVMSNALERGGHVRLGFENNSRLPDGEIADNNAALIHSFVSSHKANVRKPASSDEIRATFFR